MEIPKIYNIEKIDFVLPQKINLKNNIPLYVFSDDKNNIIKLDIVFNAGRWVENKPLIADALAALFKSGTEKLSAFELNEKIDFLGATLKASTGYNTFNLSLSCLTQFFEPCLELMNILLNEIIFPVHEIELFQKNAKAKLAINNEKSDYLADVKFKEIIFGNQHPYGYSATNNLIDNITQNEIVQYYQEQIVTDNCMVFVAGNIQEQEIQKIENVLGNWQKYTTKKDSKSHQIQTSSEKNCIIKKQNAAQASIVLGKQMFNKHNKDYGVFLLLNTILGGYFGSRLMSNIREDKGLTYGIYSALHSLKYEGFWAIYTDTNLDKLELCMQEIKSEIRQIQETLIADDEIQLARNYLLGRFLKHTDGTFNLMETFKSYAIEEIDIKTFSIFIDDIRNADAKKLQEIAQKSLTLDSMFEVIVA